MRKSVKNLADNRITADSACSLKDEKTRRNKTLQKKSSRKSRTQQLSRNGWLPNYHGAWAMVAMPALIGMLRFGFAGPQILLLACWIIGYFCFFAISLWLKSHGRRRYLPAIFTYFIPSAIIGAILAIYEWRILLWVPIYLPLVAVSFRAAWQRRERSLENDFATITAASLILPITALLSGTQLNYAEVCAVTFSVLSYFIGTVFYVKTNIRNRGARSWYLTSIGFHGVVTSVISCIYMWTYVSLAHVLIWMLIVLRAVLVPLYGIRFKWLSAKQIGIAEFIISFLFLFTLI